MKIDLKDFNHLESGSSYNHNYYEHKITGGVILVRCDEFFNEIVVYRVVGDNVSHLVTHYGEDDGVYYYD